MFTPSSTFNGLANHQNSQFGFPNYITGGVAGSPATNLGMLPHAGSSALSPPPPPTQTTLSGSQSSLFENIYGGTFKLICVCLCKIFSFLFKGLISVLHHAINNKHQVLDVK